MNQSLNSRVKRNSRKEILEKLAIAALSVVLAAGTIIYLTKDADNGIHAEGATGVIEGKWPSDNIPLQGDDVSAIHVYADDNLNGWDLKINEDPQENPTTEKVEIIYVQPTNNETSSDTLRRTLEEATNNPGSILAISYETYENARKENIFNSENNDDNSGSESNDSTSTGSSGNSETSKMSESTTFEESKDIVEDSDLNNLAPRDDRSEKEINDSTAQLFWKVIKFLILGRH